MPASSSGITSTIGGSPWTPRSPKSWPRCPDSRPSRSASWPAPGPTTRWPARHAGHVTGGIVFGYANVRIEGHVERQIHEPEAAVVRRIFTDYAHGIGLKALAAALIAEQAPAPVPRRRAAPGWAPSAIHAMLPASSTAARWSGAPAAKRRGRADESPAVAAGDGVDSRRGPGAADRLDALWQAVQARRRAIGPRRPGGTRGAPSRRPSWPGSRAARAAAGRSHARSRTHGGPGHHRRVYLYACMAHYTEPPLRQRRRAPDRDPGRRRPGSAGPRPRAPTRSRPRSSGHRSRNATPGPGSAERRAALDRELARIDARTARLTEAVAAGGAAVGPLLDEARRGGARAGRRSSGTGRDSTPSTALPTSRPPPCGAPSSGRRVGTRGAADASGEARDGCAFSSPRPRDHAPTPYGRGPVVPRLHVRGPDLWGAARRDTAEWWGPRGDAECADRVR